MHIPKQWMLLRMPERRQLQRPERKRMSLAKE
jgi:hypothetical protein